LGIEEKPETEYVIEFEKELEDVYVDYDDEPETILEGDLDEGEKTYKNLRNTKKYFPKVIKFNHPTVSLYCAYVKEILPEEIVAIHKIKFTEAQLEVGDMGDFIPMTGHEKRFKYCKGE
jgi:hypothetical protein